MPKIVNFGEFLKTETCGQKVLPDRSVLIGPKIVENPKLKILKNDNLSGQKFIRNAKNNTF